MMRATLLVLGLVGGLASARAMEVPPHTDLVVDQAQLLSPAEQQEVSASLKQFQAEFGPQIQLLTVNQLEGETIESYAIKVADAWKLGTAQKDDGVLLLISREDRALRIEVGQGLEGILPDVVAGRIIRGTILPYFKQGQFSAGTIAGLQAIAHGLGGELRNVPVYQVRTTERKSSNLGIFFFLLLLFLSLSRFGRRRSGSFGSGLLLGGLLGSRGRGGGWGGGGGFGGGGFGGGGGGGFSGGGASGNW